MTRSSAAGRKPMDSRPPHRNYSRWRAASLLLVHVLIAAHVTHWVINGKTLAPLELNEVMYTFELGIVTAGFLFMAIVTLGTLVLGRFFCSWACHILALQDLCHWILGKLHVRPRPIRSRALLWAPVVAAFYMFVWPQVVRVSQGYSLPPLHFRTDAEGWASLATENFWRNLPGPGITLLTFGVCGFLIVYVLGSRGFCTYGCPYGAVFRLADRFAPGRIRLAGSDCSRCGACTAVCGSNIRVHEELNRYGTVTSSACLKDLDCVAACPSGNVYFGFGKPAIWKSLLHDAPIRKRLDFAFWEEVVMVLVFLAVLVIYRGLYDRVPFLLSLGLGGIVAFLVVMSLRLIRRPELQWNRLTLRVKGRLTREGMVFASLMTVLVVFSAHSAWVRWHSVLGRRAASLARDAGSNEFAGRAAIEHLSMASRWGLLRSERDATLLADLNYELAGRHFRANRMEHAERLLRAALSVRPDFAMAHYDLGALLVERSEFPEGIEHLRASVRARPEFAEGHYNLGLAYWMTGARDEARRELETALRLSPDDERTRRLFGLMTGEWTP